MCHEMNVNLILPTGTVGEWGIKILFSLLTINLVNEGSLFFYN